ncbi:MAG: 50S ribosomal protein L6 [Methanobacteriota archaeon]|nr:MAG: 50S ribosomal protein L6 [Euryarchaeota archaeon]
MPVAGFIERVVDVPDGVQVQIEGGHVVVKGPRHALRRVRRPPAEHDRGRHGRIHV